MLLQAVDLAADVALEVGVGLPVLAHHAARVVDLLFEPVVADAVGGFLQLARRLAFVAPHLARHAIELLLELVDLGFEIVLALADLPRALARPGRCALDCVSDIASCDSSLMLARDLLRLLLRALHVALAARALLLLEPALRLAQLSERGAGLAGAARIAGGRRAPHGVGGLPHLLRRLREIGTVALARQALELPRGFFGLLRQRALARAAALAALAGERLLPLPLGFLLLPARELAQLLHQRIDLLIGLLLLRALRGLVLVGQLVEILLEELGEILLTPIRPRRHHRRRRRAAG